MRHSLRLWQLVLVVCAICGIVLGILYFRHSRSMLSNASILSRMPVDRTVVVAVDVKALRTAGVLELIAGSRGVEDLEYQKFVKDTGFDYREDLDYIAAAFDSEHKYFMLRGTFDWPLLTRYARQAGGQCLNGFCMVRGSSPRRNISFFAASPNVLGLAVGFAPRAAYTLMPNDRPNSGLAIPDSPFWVSMPGPLLSADERLPDGVKAFASTLSGAERVTVAVDSGATGFSANLEADCPTPEQAAAMRDKLRTLTDLLGKMIRRSGQSVNPDDLSGVLTAGQFDSDGAKVTGKWPIPRALLEAISSGTL